MQVYVVAGSQDGTFAVCRSKKKALQKGLDYVGEWNPGKKLQYSKKQYKEDLDSEGFVKIVAERSDPSKGAEVVINVHELE